MAQCLFGDRSQKTSKCDEKIRSATSGTASIICLILIIIRSFWSYNFIIFDFKSQALADVLRYLTSVRKISDICSSVISRTWARNRKSHCKPCQSQYLLLGKATKWPQSCQSCEIRMKTCSVLMFTWILLWYSLRFFVVEKRLLIDIFFGLICIFLKCVI